MPDFEESLVAAFERAVTAFPSRVALGSDLWRPTYRELNETANRLAHRLIALGIASGDRVAILMAHDAPLVAAVLGILKAGQIVVALDPEDPAARLGMLVEDAEPSVIVTDTQNRTLAAELAGSGRKILNFELEPANQPLENPSIEILPEQTAFLTYTSGTTGVSKGVMQTHRQLRRAAAAHSEAMQYTEMDRIPYFAMVSTGQGTVGLWWILLNGAMLCPFSLKARGFTGLADWIIDSELTVYVSSASIFRTLIKTVDPRLVFSRVRAVRLASEAVTADDFKAFQSHFPPTSVLVHGLSSSETSNIAWSRWTQNDDVPEDVLPVGHFSRDVEVSLVAEDGRPVAPGEIGEIVVKSRYLAAGYWRDQELTSERFSDDLDGNGTRQLRTGDLGSLGADGLLHFRGRKDDRIKIRGHRIEVLDIERTLERLPGIDRAAAVAVPRENHEPMLVAFVVKTSDASWTPPRLRHALSATLPLHTVPSKIVLVDALPYNKGNKIDREALRQYSLPAHDDREGEKPQTETEVLIAHIWGEILELPVLDRHNDFFNLGGDSLRAAVVAAQVHAAFGVELSLGAIADHSTVSTLAAFVDECRRTDAAGTPAIVRVARAPSMPLSFFQEVMWSHCLSPWGTLVRSYRVIGPLDTEIFEECLSYLVDRHEILRTTFDIVDGCPAQIIHPSSPLGFSVIDLAEADDAEAGADLLFLEATSRASDLTTLPIMRHMLIRIASENYRFIRISNDILSDGFSARILDAELATLYEARLKRMEPPLPKEASRQYADYAAWQRQYMGAGTPYFQNALDWWKGILSSVSPESRLPFKLSTYRAGLDPSEGVLQWALQQETARRLDEIARRAGATYFTVRLAAFAALIADVTGDSTVLIGTFFDGRDRVETRNIVGRFANSVSLLFTYDASKTFLQWLEIVRDRVYEAKLQSGLPQHMLFEQLRAAGIQPPETQFVFMQSSHHSDQRFGKLRICNEFWDVGTMPGGCMVYVDEQNPEQCRVNFDAGLYDRNGMRTMLERYLRLLEAAGRKPELSMGKLQTMIGAKPLRWAYARHRAAVFEFLTRYYDSSRLLKMCWRYAKRKGLVKRLTKA